jgi:hypothetical protein
MGSERNPAVKFPLCVLGVVAVSLSICLPLNAWGAGPGGNDVSTQTVPQASQGASRATDGEITIPGPLRSFLRMAGISQKISSEDVLPLLGRNVYAQGYEGSAHPTEFLILLSRYVQQARELTGLAGPDGMIRVANCEQAAPLLRVLGYRLRQQDCGKSDTSLETAEPERAFLTIDSGFPLAELEHTLQGGAPFAHAYHGARVPLLFTEADWTTASKRNEREGSTNLLDVMMRDPAIARLYWAISRLDPDTRAVLRQTIGFRRLTPYAPVLDFYGSRLCVRSGKVVVPGGSSAEAAWKDLVGADPQSPGDFVLKLVAKDRGWLSAYFDALSRVKQSQQAYFTDPRRIRRFYEALRTPEPSADATRGSFRPAPGLLLLVTRLQWSANGDPRIPGDLAVWKDILRQKTDSNVVRDIGKHADRVKTPDELIQAMFSLSRAITEVGPLQVYLTLSEVDARRPAQRRLSPETVHLMARKFAEFSNQYWIFAEFPELSDTAISQFLETAASIDATPNSTLRGNVLGTFQANVGIWQIFARQGQIRSENLDTSWLEVIKPFAKVRSSAQLFDAGRASLAEVLRAATGKASASQDEIIELLAGPQQTETEAKRMHAEVANRIRAVMDGQRLVSLDTLLALGQGLNEKAQGKPVSDGLLNLAGQLREFEMPRPIFTSGERTEWAAGIYNNRHTDLQMRTDLTKVIKGPATRLQLDEARGQLASFFRDTLVGLNYAYYEPPGAQALHNNPLFVRSHDFSAETVGGMKTLWQAPQLFGEGSPAGGGAHLVGSLADLPYVLSEMEQDFIAPENVQALIWRELVPGLLTSAVLPRWWDVTRNELHAVALYQRAGEELLQAAADKPELRDKVMLVLSERMSPQTEEQIDRAVRDHRIAEILPRMMPADTFYLALEFRTRYPENGSAFGSAGEELEGLSRQYPQEVSWERLSQHFGVPHPTLAQTYARELINVGPFPAFSGYSSRLLAESWDSGNLYWARLVDEVGSSPVALNRLVPELTRRMVEKIFATDFEDWPALLRAMREAGEEFRQGKVASLPVTQVASQP